MAANNQLPPQLQNANSQAMMEYFQKLAAEKGSAGLAEAAGNVDAFNKTGKMAESTSAAQQRGSSIMQQQQKEIKQKQTQTQTQTQTQPKVKKAEVYDNKAATDTFNYEPLLREYGNNFFELYTYDLSIPAEPYKNMYRLAGVLKTLPSFSMSTTWTEGPAASVSDMVKGFMNSDVMEIVQACGGYDRSWVSMDEGSDRTYESVTEPTFDLDFRVYTNETIGTSNLTNWKTWLNGLSLFAQPSVSNKVSINAMGNNVINGASGTIDNLNKVTDAIKETAKDSGGYVNAMKNLGNTVSTVLDEAAVYVTSRDDLNRVQGEANKKSYYGAKLWKLKVLPGIIQRPLIVYINNWSVTFSKERTVPIKDKGGNSLEMTEPIYVDFKIKCTLDQKPNAGTWMYYLENTYSLTSADSMKTKKTFSSYASILNDTPINVSATQDNKYYSEASMLNTTLTGQQSWSHSNQGWSVVNYTFDKNYFDENEDFRNINGGGN